MVFHTEIEENVLFPLVGEIVVNCRKEFPFYIHGVGKLPSRIDHGHFQNFTLHVPVPYFSYYRFDIGECSQGNHSHFIRREHILNGLGQCQIILPPALVVHDGMEVKTHGDTSIRCLSRAIQSLSGCRREVFFIFSNNRCIERPGGKDIGRYIVFQKPGDIARFSFELQNDIAVFFSKIVEFIE